jgi:hypothetical protein
VTEAAIEVVASRRRSLIVSEWSCQNERMPSGGWYWRFGGFLELYNNTDTTIYLDGKLLAVGFGRAWDYSLEPCAELEPWRLDPDGLWVFFIDQFPGAGAEYPLSPGATAVIATDAIDHRQYAPEALDLSDADFEFFGGGDVDNPQVPNMESVGPREIPFGHGTFYLSLDEIVVIADPVDLAALPRDGAPGWAEMWRLPAEKILDVATWRLAEGYGTPPCPRMVNERFDRQEATLFEPGSYDLRSGQRRGLYFTPQGRAVLQHTRTSARDFVALTRSPGTLP